MFGTPKPSEALLRHRREAILAFVEQTAADQRVRDYEEMLQMLVVSGPALTRDEFRDALHAYNDAGVPAVRQYLDKLEADQSRAEIMVNVPEEQAQKAVVRTVSHGMKKLGEADLMKYGIDEDIQNFLAVKLKMEYENSTTGAATAVPPQV